jgi:hypothetical protein
MYVNAFKYYSATSPFNLNTGTTTTGNDGTRFASLFNVVFGNGVTGAYPSQQLFQFVSPQPLPPNNLTTTILIAATLLNQAAQSQFAVNFANTANVQILALQYGMACTDQVMQISLTIPTSFKISCI